MKDRSEGNLTSLGVVAEYVAALARGDSEGMDALRGPEYVLDLVERDAFEEEAMSHDETRAFWPAWFASFPEMDYHVTRTIAAETVVVSQWVFLGTNSGPLSAALFGRDREPTGRTVRFRGVSIYDLQDGLILRETIYVDLATLLVELGGTL
jgi:steroid delta-isomerase-like uncharacterized protein